MRLVTRIISMIVTMITHDSNSFDNDDNNKEYSVDKCYVELMMIVNI